MASLVELLYTEMIAAMGVAGLSIPLTAVKFFRRSEPVPAAILDYHPDELTLTSCQAARQAALGDPVCLTRANIGCVAAAITLGLVDAGEERFLEELGFAVTYLEVDREGRVAPQAVREELRPDTLLVAIMAANNEVGTINPIGEIGQLCRAAGVPLMVDAVQAWGRLALHPRDLGISLLSLSGHKIYAPKGVGALYVEEGCELVPLIHGGEQEFGLRAGTENVGSIAALGRASALAHDELEAENRRLLGLRAFFLKELRRIEPDLVVNGSEVDRLPQNLSIGFPGVDSGALLLSLDQIGVYVSSGSACSAGSTRQSHVLQAMGVDTRRYGVIRFSFGLQTREADLLYLFKYLPSILPKLRAASAND